MTIINFLKLKKDENGNYYLRKTRGAGAVSKPTEVEAEEH
jgi:hypothetical protein